MSSSTIKNVLGTLLVLIVVLVGVGWYFGFSFGLSRFFAAPAPIPCLKYPCPGYTMPPTPTTSSTTSSMGTGLLVAGTVACSPVTQTVGVNVSATVTATQGSGTYTWYAPVGVPPAGSGSSFVVKYVTAGIKKATVQSLRGDGSGNLDSVACTIIVTP